MDRTSAKKWFASLSENIKQLFLLDIIYGLTLVARDASTNRNVENRLKQLWIISELTHRLVGYLRSAVAKTVRYPDDVIIDILVDHLERPELKSNANQVWEAAVVSANKHGATPGP